MKNKLISLFLLVWILAALPLSVLAQSFDYSQKGSISVTLVSQDPAQPMVGAELSVYQVAEAGINTRGELNFVCLDNFAQGGIRLEDPDLIAKLDAFVSQNTVPARKIVTDDQGQAVCTDLPPGLYFVKQTSDVPGFATCASFLVTLPSETEEGYDYHVNASPKTDVARLTDITIRKIWNTGSSVVPGSVTVQLLRGEQVVQTATLSAANNWKVTYTDLPESDSYTVKEINVPQGYAATYSRNGYVFTVTNTPALAQTGQLVWPIPVFAIAGLLLLLTGFVILRKSGKHNG